MKWNWLGHILRLEEHRVMRQVHMKWVRPTPDSLFDGALDVDVRKASEIATDREKWKSLRPSKVCFRVRVWIYLDDLIKSKDGVFFCVYLLPLRSDP